MTSSINRSRHRGTNASISVAARRREVRALREGTLCARSISLRRSPCSHSPWIHSMQDNTGKNGKDQKNWIDRVRNRNGDKEGQNGEPGQSRPRVPSWLIGVLILALIGWYLYQNFVPRADTDITS